MSVKSLRILAVALLVATAPATALAAQRIGTASTVKNRVTGNIAGQLAPGAGVHQHEVITSDTGAEAQLIFVDETIFNVGSGATVTLDEFIYNPNQKAGNIVVNVTKGAFRFISGSAKPESYTIKTPVATIGVRGTIFTGNVLSDLFMSLELLEGKLWICLKPGANIEGAGIEDAEPVRRNGEDCYLVDPGTFNIGFGPTEDWDNPGNDSSDPNDADEDPIDQYMPGFYPFEGDNSIEEGDDFIEQDSSTSPEINVEDFPNVRVDPNSF